MYLENLTGVEVGSAKDNDQVFRQMGFEANDTLAIYRFSDGVEYSCFTLGEQRITGLNGTEREGEVIRNEPDYVLENYDALFCDNDSCDTCWISVDCLNKGVVENKLSDEIVWSSLSEFNQLMNSLESYLKTGGSHRGFWQGSEE